jgi:hypothetical protein
MIRPDVHARWSHIPPQNWRPVLNVPIQVSFHDRLTAMLAASVLLGLIAVTIMFALWLVETADRPIRLGWPMVEEMPMSELPIGSTAMDWQALEKSELPEAVTIELANALEPITDAVSNVRAIIAGLYGDYGEGDQPGTGNDRHPGVIPVKSRRSLADRWRVHIAAANPGEYAEMLDYFGIEVGVVHKYSNLLEYVSELTKDQPLRKEKLRKDEKRLFFISRQNRLRAWDEAMGRRVGIDLTDTLTGHFFPEALRQSLLEKERAAVALAGRELDEVRETHFGVRRTGEGFEHYVVEVIYTR